MYSINTSRWCFELKRSCSTIGQSHYTKFAYIEYQFILSIGKFFFDISLNNHSNKSTCPIGDCLFFMVMNKSEHYLFVLLDEKKDLI